MTATCERCQKEKCATNMSEMNEDLICEECLEEEKNHPRYKEAKLKMELENRKGNHDYPGFFAGQRYPFSVPHGGAAISKNKCLKRGAER